MSDKLFYKAGELQQDLIDNRKLTFSRGENTGFHILDQIASFKAQSTTVIYSPPHVGKSVITLDILMSLAERGNHIFIYSPEFRKPQDLLQALIQTKLSKSLFGKYGEDIETEEYLEALNFIHRMFTIVQKPKRRKDGLQPKMTIQNIFSQAKYAEEFYETKFSYIFADPFNYIDKNEQQRAMQEQEYVLDANDMLAEFSESLNVHTIISAHTRDMELITDKETGVQFYPVGHPSQIMGGQSWYRASYQILHFWRAPEGVRDKNGYPYPKNYTKIFNQKAKPWGSGKIGNTGSIDGMDGLYFDEDTYTMYEVINGKKYYRNQYYGLINQNAAKGLQPSKSFEKSIF